VFCDLSISMHSGVNRFLDEIPGKLRFG